jgi:hypothetical protein
MGHLFFVLMGDKKPVDNEIDWQCGYTDIP